MQQLKIILAAAFVAALWITAQAQAGQREGAFSLSPMVGYHLFEGDQNTDDAFIGGLSLGYNVSKRWAAELEVRDTKTETNLPGTSGDVDAWSIGVNGLYHFNPEGPFVPYLSAGFGIMFFDDDGVGASGYYDDNGDYMMNWGAGAKYFVGNNTALRLDLRHVIDFHSDRDWDHDGADKVDNNLLVTAGIYWQFGGPALPPPPPPDSDADGIYDLRDKCPGTPLGVLVDAVGCPPVERVPTPPKPAKTFIDGDDDGDGVPNSRDKCPGTDKGLIVDENGCPVKFTLQIEFDFDKAEVRPQYHDKLLKAAEFIKKYPETRFLLAGHTDSKGSEEYNKELSLLRAAAVKKYLVEKFGIAAHLMTPRGYGESRPVDSNDTELGRQHNRRVEVICSVLIPPE